MAFVVDKGSLITVSSFLSSWTVDPVMAVLVALAAAAYWRAVRRARRSGTFWPLARTVGFFALGLGPVVLATMSGLAVYRGDLLWPAATGNTLLLVLVPVGVAFGDPLRLARTVLSPDGRDRLERVLRARVLRVLMFPALSAVLGVGTEMIVYFTPYFAATLHNYALQELLYLQLLGTGILFVVPLVAEELLPAWCTYPVRAAIAFLDGLLDAAPGVIVMLSTSVVGGSWYLAHSGATTQGLRHSQEYAGGLMLTLAEALACGLLVAVLVEWFGVDARETATVDRALDHAETRVAARMPTETADLTPPWWETDPSVHGPWAERFRTKRPLPPQTHPLE